MGVLMGRVKGGWISRELISDTLLQHGADHQYPRTPDSRDWSGWKFKV